MGSIINRARHKVPARRRRPTVEILEPRLALSVGPLVISELLAVNDDGRIDSDGYHSDWIEIHNPTDSAVSLEGWHLTDDSNDLDAWGFPATTLDAGSFLVVYASSKDRTDPTAELHTNFKLSSDGEFLALVRPDGAVADQFSPRFGKQKKDISLGLSQQVTRTLLVEPDSTADVFIPLDESLGTTWTGSADDEPFDASGWLQGTASIGYETEATTAAVNIGPTGTATQSSQYSGSFPASNALDGNFTNITHTANQANSYWRLELPEAKHLGSIVLWNRVNCCEERLSNFRVSVFDASMREVFGRDFYTPEQGGGYPPAGGSVSIDLPPGVWGKTIQVQLQGLNGEGTGYLSLAEVELFESSGYLELFDTDLRQAMEGVNASVFLRVPFDVTDPATFDLMNLDIRYDDGFIAHLNGREVARRNTPPEPYWDTGALADRPDSQAILFERIHLTEHLDALKPGSNVLSFHGLNRSSDDVDFLLAPQLEALSVTSSSDAFYFPTPTPGSLNEGPSYIGFTPGVELSHERGFYDNPVDVALSVDLPQAVLRYTIDGSLPTLDTGTLYDGPIHVDRITTLRVAAFLEGYLPSEVVTHSFLFVANVRNQDGAGFPTDWGGFPANYEVDSNVVDDPAYQATFEDDLKTIPTMSIVMNVDDLFGSGGIYSNTAGRGVEWERPASIELIYPDGSEGFDVDSGVRIFGYGWRPHSATPKHSFRLIFKEKYGPAKLDYRLFADSSAERFDNLVLRAQGSRGWNDFRTSIINTQYMRDSWGRDVMREMGQLTTHATYVHLYLNGLYWGLYNPVERPDAAFMSEYLGGNEDDYDALNARVGNIEVIDGDRMDWDALIALADAGLASEQAYARVQQSLDVDNLIDYMILNFYAGNRDWPGSNGNNMRVAGGPDVGVGFQAFVWDFEYSLWNASDNNLSVNASHDSPAKLHARLMSNDEYRMWFADRVQRHLFGDGPLTPDRAAALWMARAEEIDRAIIGESARWGDTRREPPYTRDIEWIAEQNRLVTQYFPQRTDILLDQFRAAGLYPDVEAPRFNQRGGQVSAPFTLEITAPMGTIFYSLDGSDPRQPGAIAYTGPVSLDVGATVKARVYDGTQWSALNEAEFFINQPAVAGTLIVTELNYNPHDPTPDELALNEAFTSGDFEFVELLNTSDETLDLTGVRFVDGVTFDFTDSLVTLIAPGEYVVAVSNRDAFEARYGTTIRLAGTYTGHLDNGGESMELLDRFNRPILQYTYNDAGDWPGRADGKGSSLEAIDSSGDPDDAEHWRPSREYGGTPGTAGMGPLRDVVVNEVFTHTDPPDIDSVELLNITENPIDIGGWFLSDSSSNYRKYRIADGTLLPPEGYLVFDEHDFNASGGIALTDFAFDAAHGDDVWLLAADSEGRLLRFVDHVEFRAAALGEPFGRYPNGLGLMTPLIAPTFGSENAPPRFGPVILSEIHYNPGTSPESDAQEFVEIYNASPTPVDLTEWRIRGGVDFDFSTGTILSPYSALVVATFDPTDPADADKGAVFLTAFGPDASTAVVGRYSGRLSDSGERVRLERPDEPPLEEPGFIPRLIEEEIAFDDAAPWWPSADGQGDSLHRIAACAWGGEAAGWVSDTPSPGTYYPTFNLDVDANGTADALTDGLLTLRSLFGFSGTSMVDRVLALNATRTDPDEIAAFLAQSASTMLDIDADGRADALTDGVILLRYLFGFDGASLTSGAIAPGAFRTNPTAIVEFLDSCHPTPMIAPSSQPNPIDAIWADYSRAETRDDLFQNASGDEDRDTFESMLMCGFFLLT